jgi:hypothetical protein
MRQESGNPASNALPSSVDETELLRAIESSGYPLQGIVADKLKSLFGVTEEWGYIDRDTKEHRSLDILAHKRLAKDTDCVIQPCLVLLTECKTSVHPFVFFKSVTDRAIPGFPAVAGLKRGIVEIRESKRGRISEVKGAHALGLHRLSFIQNGPPRCSVFSRAVLSGKKVEMSGTELFNSLVLPLVKALDHAYCLYRDRQQPTHLSPNLLLSIGVLDAPMILVESPHLASDPILTPWVRVVRQESVEDPNSLQRFRYYGIEIVHIDYFDEFLSEHLIPFAEEFSRRSVEKAEILLHGGTKSTERPSKSMGCVNRRGRKWNPPSCTGRCAFACGRLSSGSGGAKVVGSASLHPPYDATIPASMVRIGTRVPLTTGCPPQIFGSRTM